MLWKDTYTMTKKLHGYSAAAGGMTSLFSLLALFSIVIGLVASIFSRSAPYAVAIAANGGLWSMMFLIMVCHLEMMEFLPIVLLAIICVLYLTIFIGYWYYCGRDLMVRGFIFASNVLLLLCFLAILQCWGLRLTPTIFFAGFPHSSEMHVEVNQHNLYCLRSLLLVYMFLTTTKLLYFS